MQPSITRSVRLLGMRGFASHTKPHVYMPETAMLTNNVRILFAKCILSREVSQVCDFVTTFAGHARVQAQRMGVFRLYGHARWSYYTLPGPHERPRDGLGRFGQVKTKALGNGDQWGTYSLCK